MSASDTHCSLFKQLLKRDIIGRYRGSVLGIVWAFITPLLMLAVYTFVFGIVFKVRWGQETGETGAFAIMLFSGLMLHSFFAECLHRAPGLITGNVNYVKKVVFPLPLLVPVAVGSALFHLVIATGILLGAVLYVQGTLSWTIVAFPLVLLPFVCLTLGLCYFLASLGVYLRDISQTIGIITTALLFLGPIFYPISALPAYMQDYIYLNPLSVIVEETRLVLLEGQWPGESGLGLYYYYFLGPMVFVLGYEWFKRTQKGFADVL